MPLCEMIDKRRSTRSFYNEPVDEDTLRKIRAFSTELTPLYPEIRVCSEIIGRENVYRFLPWTTPQLIAVFSERTEGAFENVGFMFQQLDLYLHSLGLGVCWLGMGRLNNRGSQELKQDDGLDFVITLAFGRPKKSEFRSGPNDFRRKPLSAISDRPDPRLEPARLAPSSVNSQPWYFTHDGDLIHAHCSLHGLWSASAPSDMNLIDMGIALAHLYAANPNSFRFLRPSGIPSLKGYRCIGSVSL